MRNLSIFIIIAVLITGTAFAQPIKDQREAELQLNKERGNRQERSDRPEKARQKPQQKDNSLSIEGELKLEKGLVAVQSGEKVYLVPMLNRYIGFINGLREGEKVIVEGREFRNIIQPSKVTISGKAYDFTASSQYASPRGFDFDHQFKDRNNNNKTRFDHNKHEFGRKKGCDRNRFR